MVEWDVRGRKRGAERVPECLAGGAGAGKLPSSRLSLLPAPCSSRPLHNVLLRGEEKTLFLERFFGLSAKQNPWTARSFHSIQLLPQPHNLKELEIPG